MLCQPTILNAPPECPPWEAPRFRAIPGARPVDADGWLRATDTFAAQMALRDRLITERPGAVIAAVAGSEPAVAELWEVVLEALSARQEYSVSESAVRRPDGVEVPLDPDRPLATLGRLVQEDLCLLEKRGPEYAMTAAVVCFPLKWTLAEKIGRPLTRIHAPVKPYDAEAAKRVGRLFEGLKPGRPIERANGSYLEDPALFQPETEAFRHGAAEPEERTGRYFRSERQCLVRLSRTGAVLFTILTSQWDAETLPERPA